MSIKKLKLTSFKKLYFISIVLFLLVSVKLLNAATIVYFEYDAIEDVFCRITEVDGIIVDKTKVDENGVVQ